MPKESSAGAPGSRRGAGATPEIAGRPETIIKKRVLGFFYGADASVTNGAPQIVGPYTVTIHEGPATLSRDASRKTIWRATSNGIPLAERVVEADRIGEVTFDSYSLHGRHTVNGPIELIVNERPDSDPHIRVTLTRKEIARNVDAGRITSLEREDIKMAFGIDIPKAE